MRKKLLALLLVLSMLISVGNLTAFADYDDNAGGETAPVSTQNDADTTTDTTTTDDSQAGETSAEAGVKDQLTESAEENNAVPDSTVITEETTEDGEHITVEAGFTNADDAESFVADAGEILEDNNFTVDEDKTVVEDRTDELLADDERPEVLDELDALEEGEHLYSDDYAAEIAEILLQTSTEPVTVTWEFDNAGYVDYSDVHTSGSLQEVYTKYFSGLVDDYTKIFGYQDYSAISVTLSPGTKTESYTSPKQEITLYGDGFTLSFAFEVMETLGADGEGTFSPSIDLYYDVYGTESEIELPLLDLTGSKLATMGFYTGGGMIYPNQEHIEFNVHVRNSSNNDYTIVAYENGGVSPKWIVTTKGEDGKYTTSEFEMTDEVFKSYVTRTNVGANIYDLMANDLTDMIAESTIAPYLNGISAWEFEGYLFSEDQLGPVLEQAGITEDELWAYDDFFEALELLGQYDPQYQALADFYQQYMELGDLSSKSAAEKSEFFRQKYNAYSGAEATTLYGAWAAAYELAYRGTVSDVFAEGTLLGAGDELNDSLQTQYYGTTKATKNLSYSTTGFSFGESTMALVDYSFWYANLYKATDNESAAATRIVQMVGAAAQKITLALNSVFVSLEADLVEEAEEKPPEATPKPQPAVTPDTTPEEEPAEETPEEAEETEEPEAPAVEEPEEKAPAEETPAEEASEGETEAVERITEEAVPLANGGAQAWSLVNLAITVATLLMAVFAVLNAAKKKSLLAGAAPVLGIAVVAGLAIFFLTTENLNNPMGLVNKNTVIYGGAAVADILSILKKKVSDAAKE